MSLFKSLTRSIAESDRRNRRFLLACLGAALAFGMLAGACGDDPPDDGEEIGEAQLRLEAISSFDGDDDMLRFDDTDGSVYSWTEAELVVDQMELDLPGDNDDCDNFDDILEGPVECDDGVLEDEEIRIDGPFTVNLADGTTSLSDEDLTIPALDYEEVDVEVDELESDDDTDARDELINHTFFGLADFEDNGNGQELFAQFEFDEEATVGEDDEDLGPENGETLIIEFDVVDWFDGIPITECLDMGDLEEDGDQVIVDGDSEG
ncbi:MAG: hypothetical protein ACOCV2_10715, partial [Persicimonas sp.]